MKYLSFCKKMLNFYFIVLSLQSMLGAGLVRSQPHQDPMFGLMTLQSGRWEMFTNDSYFYLHRRSVLRFFFCLTILQLLRVATPFHNFFISYVGKRSGVGFNCGICICMLLLWTHIMWSKELSMQLKQAIVRLQKQNKSIREIAGTLKVAKSTIW